MAAIIPTYSSPSVDIRPVSTPQARAAGADSFGAGFAKGLSDVGQMGTEIYQRIEQQNNVETAQAFQGFEGALRNKISAEIKAVQGEYAFGNKDNPGGKLKPLMEEYDKQVSEWIQKNSGNEKQQAFLANHAAISRNHLDATALEHEASEKKKYQQTQFKTVLELSLNTMAETAADPARVDEFSAAFDSGLKNITAFAAAHGWSKEQLDSVIANYEKEVDATTNKAVYQAAESAVLQNPDSVKSVLEQHRQDLREDQVKKLEDLSLNRERVLIEGYKDIIVKNYMLKPFEKRELVDKAGVLSSNEYLEISKRDPDKALSLARSIEVHNESVAVDAVMDDITRKRLVGGVKAVTDYRQIDPAKWRVLVENAPAKAGALMEKFDYEKELRREQAEASNQQKMSEARILAAVTIDPRKTDVRQIVEARDAGQLSVGFADALIKAVDSGGDYLGKVKRHMDILDQIVDARLPMSTETVRRAAKDQMLGVLVAAMPSIYKNANDISSKDVAELANDLDAMILKKKGVWGGEVSGSTVNEIAIPAEAQSTISIIRRRNPALTEAQAYKVLQLQKTRGGINPYVHGGGR